MPYQFDERARARLDAYVSSIGEILGNEARRASFAAYAIGLFGNAERKSMEPIASYTTGQPERCSAVHQKIHHFVSVSEWDDKAVRSLAAGYAIDAMQRREPVTTWVIDDTGFLKQGTESVGVQRQYTGTAGKVANSQIGVSLSVASSHAHVPIDFELYLPESWVQDLARREKAKIPHDMGFRTKEALAIKMFERAVADNLPGEIVLADAWYGRSARFRDTIWAHGFDYAVGILPTQKVWVLGKGDSVTNEARVTVRSIARGLSSKRFRTISWRHGVRQTSRGSLKSRFAFVRVAVPGEYDRTPELAERQWLMVEWGKGQPDPTNYVLTTLPRRMKKKEIVRIFKERYRTEQVYQEMKSELGLDHFEGRSFRGWHHHVTVAIACHAFIVSELLNAFPPSARRTRSHGAFAAAA